MKFSLAIASLLVLPFAAAAPTCSLKPSSAVASSTTPTSTATSPGSTSTPANPASGSVAMAWFANWHTDYTVANITWKGFNRMSYFGAITSADGTATITVADSGPSGPVTFVAAAKQNNVLPVLTIGGWDGSIYFSSSISTSSNRTTFVQSIVTMVNKYGFQGVEFDWEYPGSTNGLSCNTESPQDTANLLSMLQELKQALPTLSLSAATPVKPWNDASGNPSTDLTSFAQVLDYVEIMNYDVYGDTFSKVVGPNSPLDDSCAPAADQTGSATSAVKLWTAAGFSAKQIVLGVPSYGHGYSISQSAAVQSNTLASYPTFNTNSFVTGDSWDAAGPDACGISQPASGDFNFWGLIAGGFLNEDGSVASGMTGRFDNCSQTPYVYNPNTQVMVAYDNAESFTAKGNFIKQAGIAGFALWEMGGDYNNILLNAITSAIAS
ncbi:glycoside hydrolase family 18 protein [Suillus clintonianus]|uniref:glycoside hydrolase family 18 protein n=1 Tax=Suillus clintonianus TaxID=1904413 RepID=UPI001B8787A1|nr:glycoside hydrolase family 18 protein [Suillus clintonianus]KAG2146300.1 glycoside hydrolase family 18 protein [Suillus clintonianus]